MSEILYIASVFWAAAMVLALAVALVGWLLGVPHVKCRQKPDPCDPTW